MPGGDNLSLGTPSIKMKLLPLDLTKAPHRRVLNLFMPFIPGLFFVFSIYATRPDLRREFEQITIGFGYYTRVFVVLFTAYFVALVMGTILSTVNLMLFKAYRRDAFRLFQVDNRVVYRWLASQPQNDGVAKKLIRRFYNRWTLKRADLERYRVAARSVWGTAASTLLSKRYGIDPVDIRSPEEWDVIFNVLGTPAENFTQGSPFTRSLYVSGWLGFFAARISPQLHNQFYLGTCVALIVVGLWHDLYIAGNFGHPIRINYVQASTVLRELAVHNDKLQQSGNTDAGGDSVDESS